MTFLTAALVGLLMGATAAWLEMRRSRDWWRVYCGELAGRLDAEKKRRGEAQSIALANDKEIESLNARLRAVEAGSILDRQVIKKLEQKLKGRDARLDTIRKILDAPEE